MFFNLISERIRREVTRLRALGCKCSPVLAVKNYLRYGIPNRDIRRIVVCHCRAPSKPALTWRHRNCVFEHTRLQIVADSTTLLQQRRCACFGCLCFGFGLIVSFAFTQRPINVEPIAREKKNAKEVELEQQGRSRLRLPLRSDLH